MLVSILDASIQDASVQDVSIQDAIILVIAWWMPASKHRMLTIQKSACSHPGLRD
jgi:hypothetical protein